MLMTEEGLAFQRSTRSDWEFVHGPLVKKIRTENGYPFWDCKVAFMNALGDYELALQILKAEWLL